MEQTRVWHIAGVGAMGTIIAASFCRGQQTVELILKSEDTVSFYNSFGLRIVADSMQFKCHPKAVAYNSIETPIQRLICCTKAYDVSNLLFSLRDYLTKESIIILIHNGMGVLGEIKMQLPELRIISGITTVGGYLTEPYSVQAFLKGSTILGETLGHFTEEEILNIKEAFNKSSLNLTWTETINELIWDKFSINCSINLLTALFSCKNGELLHHADLLKNVTQEIALILSAYDKDIVADSLFAKVCTVIENTAGNYSSMNQDIKNNRLTEIHYLNAYLLQLAEQKNIPAPLTKDLLTRFYKQFPNQK
jgi:2-dehydropantoate 2-reductase